MKKNIHPTYEKTTIVCACGNKIETKSTTPSEIHVELCSACHPFYTGKQKLVDTAGRVDKFMARRKKAAAIKAATEKSTDSKEPRIDTDKSVEATNNKDVPKVVVTEGVNKNGEVVVDEIQTHGVSEETIEEIEEELEENTVDIETDDTTDKNTDSDEPLIDTEKSDAK